MELAANFVVGVCFLDHHKSNCRMVHSLGGKGRNRMGMRVWPLAVTIVATVFPSGWTCIVVLLVLELELMRGLPFFRV